LKPQQTPEKRKRAKKKKQGHEPANVGRKNGHCPKQKMTISFSGNPEGDERNGRRRRTSQGKKEKEDIAGVAQKKTYQDRGKGNTSKSNGKKTCRNQTTLGVKNEDVEEHRRVYTWFH